MTHDPTDAADSGSPAGEKPGSPAGGAGSTAAPTRAEGKRAAGGDRARRRRRTGLWIGIGVAVLLVVAMCTGAGLLVGALNRFGDRTEHAESRQERARSACVDLETRLNRLIPPGATTEPVRRAAAIRDENGAVRQFLAEVEVGRADRERGRGDEDWIAYWRQLVDARTAYANALDRQVSAGERAFFGKPLTPRGEPVADRLNRLAPQECRASIRRLVAPDL